MHKPKAFAYGVAVTTSGNQSEAVVNTFDDSVNVHGLRGKFSFCTETSSAIIGVNWAILCLPEGITVPTISDANFVAESLQNYVWLSGKCFVHRESITEVEFAPQTSRSCPEGSFMAFIVRYENAIAGTTPNLRTAVGINWWENQI